MLLDTPGVDPNLKDDKKKSPLSYAIDSTDAEVVDVLLSCPAIGAYLKDENNDEQVSYYTKNH